MSLTHVHVGIYSIQTHVIFISLTPTHSEMFSIQFMWYLRVWLLPMVRCTKYKLMWYLWVWLLSVVRCTRYKLMWYLWVTPAYDEMYSIQTHVILNEFDSCPWWDVLDTNSCNIKGVWLLPMLRCTWYKLMWYYEFDSCQRLNVRDANSCDIYDFISCPWRNVLDSTLCDRIFRNLPRNGGVLCILQSLQKRG